MKKDKILIIDDDQELTLLISRFLVKNGYVVEVRNTGEDAAQYIERFQPDLLVLDLMLPGTDGLSICRTIRPGFPNPIIMLTALDDEIDEVTGLEVGADDYLRKPISPRVLLAHIRAQLRKHGSLEGASGSAALTANNGRLRIDPATREVVQNHKKLVLSTAEFDLLHTLAKQAGQIITRDQLHRKIFHMEYDGVDRSIDIRISRLRRKLGDDPREPAVIKTVRGRGYLLAP
ncbi:response regulator [Thiolapillus brandeum]|uniref:Two-component system OmpR family response regulator n=1 Tax=Thiolapillus brandeum TaxID=1076588 RepID=A0A7U6GLF4_9GAMM|nr:response regulator [Thiolapillus brandeum]BAO45689.1 two-component system OmpR family response regulator [Thiolapillus brandeum]